MTLDICFTTLQHGHSCESALTQDINLEPVSRGRSYVIGTGRNVGPQGIWFGIMYSRHLPVAGFSWPFDLQLVDLLERRSDQIRDIFLSRLEALEPGYTFHYWQQIPWSQWADVIFSLNLSFNLVLYIKNVQSSSRRNTGTSHCPGDIVIPAPKMECGILTVTTLSS